MDYSEGKSIKEKLFELNTWESHKVFTYEIAEILGRNASHILIILFSVPMLMPITAIPGLSQITSVALIAILVQLIVGRRVLWLPKKVAKLNVDNGDLKKITGFLIKYHKKIERFVKPRYLMLTSIPALKLHYFYLIFVVLVMALPFPAPFANTIPAAGIILLTFGIIEREGISIILGYIFGIIATIYMVIVFYLGKEFYNAIF